VVVLGFWFCQFNTGSLAWGLCLSLTTKCLFGCSNLMYVFLVTVGGVCHLSFIGCRFFRVKNAKLDQGLCYLSVSLFFCPPFWCVSMVFEVH